MALQLLRGKGGDEMRILCLLALASASIVHAQEPPRHFLIEFELAPGVDITHLSQPQQAIFQQHGTQLVKLRDEGVVILGGHTDNIQHMRAVLVVKAKDTASARAIADADAAVKAGLLKLSTVEPFTLAVPPR
jgi:uncharacterized protein YciI